MVCSLWFTMPSTDRPCSSTYSCTFILFPFSVCSLFALDPLLNQSKQIGDFLRLSSLVNQQVNAWTGRSLFLICEQLTARITWAQCDLDSTVI